MNDDALRAVLEQVKELFSYTEEWPIREIIEEGGWDDDDFLLACLEKHGGAAREFMVSEEGEVYFATVPDGEKPVANLYRDVCACLANLTLVTPKLLSYIKKLMDDGIGSHDSLLYHIMEMELDWDTDEFNAFCAMCADEALVGWQTGTREDDLDEDGEPAEIFVPSGLARDALSDYGRLVVDTYHALCQLLKETP